MDPKALLSVLLSLCVLPAALWAKEGANSTSLTEKQIIEKAKTSSPRIKGIQAKQATSDFEAAQAESNYETRALGGYNYAESREEGLAPFIPVFSPQRGFQVGVSKKLPVGMKVEVQAFGEQIHAPGVGINYATRSGTRVLVEMDLLKNLLGSLDRSVLAEKRVSAQKAKAMAELESKEFEMDLRKLYWSLVANSMSLELSRALVASAEQQLKDTSQRARAGAADSGDVARSQAQLQSRTSSVYLFQYEKELLENQLKQLVPYYVGQDLLFPIQTNEIDTAVRGVLACVGEITSSAKPNLKHSQYFDVLELTKSQAVHAKNQAQSIGDWDLKLTGSVQNSGVDEGFDESIDEYQSRARDGYSVGVAVSIPLEGDLKEAERAQTKAVQASFESQVRQLELQIEQTHQQVSKSLLLLQEASISLNANVKNLETSLKASRNKYRQARISINELIGEQDQLFQSQLSEISTKVAVIHALYDYFKIFDKHPCKMNQI